MNPGQRQAAAPSWHDLEVLHELARRGRHRFLADLRELVAIDSGSYSPAGVNRVADWLAERLGGIGFTAVRIPVAGGQPTGDVLLARRPGRTPVARGGRRILLVGHLDTVFADGTAAARPLRQAGDRVLGPGASDDKGGLLAGLAAVSVLDRLGMDDYAELVFLATPDEEIGSPASRPVTERVAGGVDLALVLECARENGDLVTSRKGVADLRIAVTGRAAHAGIEPERGANAALAAAHLVVALQQLNGRRPGVTVNVGVVRAGSRTNIVCPEAEIRVEVRATTTRGLRDAIAEIHRTAAVPPVEGTSVQVGQLDLCPPMEETPASRDLFAQAQACARQLGLSVGAAATGGVGDANLISGLGVPTLDGLGPVGGGDHSDQEWLDLGTAPARIAMLAGLIARLGSPDRHRR